MRLKEVFLNVINKALSGGHTVHEWLDVFEGSLSNNLGRMALGKPHIDAVTSCFIGSYYYTDEQKRVFQQRLRQMSDICREHDVFFDTKGFREKKPTVLVVLFCSLSKYDGSQRPEYQGRNPGYIQQHETDPGSYNI